MLRLYGYEVKKLFHSRRNIVLLLALLAFPLLLLSVQLRQGQNSYGVLEKRVLTHREYTSMAEKRREELRGVIDTAWLTQREQELQDMERRHISQTDIRYQITYMAYTDARTAVTTQEHMAKDHRLSTAQRQAVRQHRFVYGPYENWLSRMDILAQSGKVYCLLCLFLFGHMFNQEEASGMMDQLKSSRYGRKQLAWAKLGCALSVAVVTGVLLYGLIYGSTAMAYAIAYEDTTTYFMQGGFQLATLAQLNVQALMLLLLGGMVCTCIAVGCSIVTDKPLASLSMAGLFYILPILLSLRFLNTNWSDLFPSRFLDFAWEKQLLQTPWVMAFEQAKPRMPFLSVLWGCIILGVILLVIWKHCHQHHAHRLKS